MDWFIATETYNFTSGNLMLFLTFLADVINQALLAKEQNRSLDIFKIITDAAGSKWGSRLMQNF